MKTRLNFVFGICVVFLAGSIALCWLNLKNNVETPQIPLTEVNTQPSEMRGMWVSYISLDMSGSDRSFESFKKKADKIISDAKDFGINTLIFQVRPFSDALYRSEIYPASHVLSGVQGEDVGFDALEYLCDACHKADMKIHAWINPYRVSTNTTPETLAKSNPFYTDGVGFETESGRYLNPAKRATREIITKGVEEIVRNYDVDGIQFDDYFYPEDCGNFDKADYEEYRKSFPNTTDSLWLDEWRKNNVNLLLSEVYRAIKRINPEVQFGISPQGNIQNNESLYADIYSWCESFGYADYICPQMYYSIENPALSFEESIKAWSEIDRHENLHIYVGLGAYKAGSSADSGTWKNNSSELKNQLELLREYGYDGYMIYDYGALLSENAAETIEVFRRSQ